MRKLTSWSAAKRRDDGFSMAEVVVAATLVLVIGAAVSMIVIGGLNLITQSGIAAANISKSQNILTTFRDDLRNAERITGTPTNTSITFDYQRDTVCERHTYTIEDDAETDGKLQLRHTIRSVDLPGGAAASCADVTDTLDAEEGGALTDRVETTGLYAGSRFYYYDVYGNQLAAAPDELTECPDTSTAPGYIDVGAVRMVLQPEIPTADSATSLDDQVQASVRNYGTGLQCA